MAKAQSSSAKISQVKTASKQVRFDKSIADHADSEPAEFHVEGQKTGRLPVRRSSYQFSLIDPL